MSLHSSSGPRISTILSTAVVLAASFACAAVVAVVHTELRRRALEEAATRAELLLERNLATHQYFTEQLKPAVNEALERNGNAEELDPIWMSSTYAVREMDRMLRNIGFGDYYYKEAAVGARSPLNEADETERDFIRALNRDGDLEREVGGQHRQPAMSLDPTQACQREWKHRQGQHPSAAHERYSRDAISCTHSSGL